MDPYYYGGPPRRPSLSDRVVQFHDASLNRLNMFMFLSQESCWRKSVLSMVMGAGMGLGFGVFMGTFDGAHGELEGATSASRIRYGMIRSVKSSWKYGKSYAKNFALAAAAFSYVDCECAKFRAKDDLWNTILAGGIAGAVFGGLPRVTKGFRHCLKGMRNGSISFIAMTLVMTKVMDYIESKKQQ